MFQRQTHCLYQVNTHETNVYRSMCLRRVEAAAYLLSLVMTTRLQFDFVGLGGPPCPRTLWRTWGRNADGCSQLRCLPWQPSVQ